MSKRALVLSGGSIKGAFQAGAIEVLTAEGFAPDAVYGISVGSLNAAFLADRTARHVAKSNRIDWPTIGRELVEFWLTKVTGPDAIIKKRNVFSLGWQVLTKKFNGLTKTDGLRDLVKSNLSPTHIANSPITLGVGSVNLVDGALITATKELPNILDYVIASTAIPIIMPFSELDDRVLVDGGVRDVAPLKFATDQNADEIVCVVCQSKKLEASSSNFHDLMPFGERVMEVVTNELVNNDLAYAKLVNANTPADGSPATEGAFVGKRRLDIKVVRPAETIKVQLDSFTRGDIEHMIEQGREAARNFSQL